MNDKERKEAIESLAYLEAKLVDVNRDKKTLEVGIKNLKEHLNLLGKE